MKTMVQSSSVAAPMRMNDKTVDIDTLAKGRLAAGRWLRLSQKRKAKGYALLFLGHCSLNIDNEH